MSFVEADFPPRKRHINGNFLLALGSGILMSILSLAKLIHYLLAVGPEYLWSFFFGLILASCWYIGRQIPHWRAPQLLAVVMGAKKRHVTGGAASSKPPLPSDFRG